MSFLINTLMLTNPVVLVQTDQAESSTRKTVIIGYPREDWKNKKISGHEVVLKRSTDVQEDIKITIKSYRLVGWEPSKTSYEKA